MLEGLIKSLKSQNYEDFEIIIGDQSSDSEILRRNLEACKRNGVMHMDVTGIEASLPATRNLMAKKSRGNIVLFLDDDVEITDKNFLREIGGVFEEKNDSVGVGAAAWATGRGGIGLLLLKIKKFLLHTMFSFDFSNKQKITGYFHNVDFYSMPRWATETEWLHGYAMAFRKSIFEKISFDEKLKKYALREDVDFCARARKYGKLYINPDARIAHNEASAGRLDFKKRAAMEFFYWYYLYWKNGKRPSRLFGYVYSLTILVRYMMKALFSFRLDGLSECISSYIFFIKNMAETELGNLSKFDEYLLGK